MTQKQIRRSYSNEYKRNATQKYVRHRLSQLWTHQLVGGPQMHPLLVTIEERSRSHQRGRGSAHQKAASCQETTTPDSVGHRRGRPTGARSLDCL